MPKTRGRARNVAPARTSFLDKWTARAVERRERLKVTLAQRPADSAKAQARLAWLRRGVAALVSRRKWLEARLAHVEDLQGILQEALADLEDPDASGRQYPTPDHHHAPVEAVINPKRM